jgi:hypothetical protein
VVEVRTRTSATRAARSPFFFAPAFTRTLDDWQQVGRQFGQQVGRQFGLDVRELVEQFVGNVYGGPQVDLLADTSS